MLFEINVKIYALSSVKDKATVKLYSHYRVAYRPLCRLTTA